VKEYNSATLKDKLSHSDDIQIIDIREPHEFSFHQEMDNCINIPLTRLVQFIQENKDDKNHEWVLVCRSGSRSLIAAQAMHRLGFEKISHLKGGYALSS
jgi:cysteine desulfurase